MSFWFGKIDTSEAAARIIRYGGICWIVWACFWVVLTVWSEEPFALLPAVFGVAAARACFERSRTATKIVFGIVAVCAGVSIVGILGGEAQFTLLKPIWVAVWLFIVLAAYRVVKAIEFLDAESAKAVVADGPANS